MSIQFPEVADINKTLGTLLARPVDLAVATAPGPAVSGQSQGYFGSALLDDGGQSRGLFLADMVATVFLGGTLMMMPAGALGQQVRSRKPEPVVIESLSEVLNNLTGLLNYFPENPHLRSDPAGPLASLEGVGEWMGSPGSRRDLVGKLGDLGEGRLIILMR